MPDREEVPRDLTGFAQAPLVELCPLLEVACKEEHAGGRPRLSAVLGDRVIELLRRASRDEILIDATALQRFLTSEAAASLGQTDPCTFGRWAMLGELLSEAARRADVLAVDSILKSHPKYGEALLQVLAAAPEAGAPRALLRQRLHPISESQLSHLLRDLEEAHLIARRRRPGGREVAVTLDFAGLELARSRRWIPQAGVVQAGSIARAESFVEAERADLRFNLFCSGPGAEQPPRAAFGHWRAA